MRYISSLIAALLLVFSAGIAYAEPVSRSECDFTDMQLAGEILYGGVVMGHGFIGSNYAIDTGFAVTDFPLKLRILLREGGYEVREATAAFNTSGEQVYVIVYRGNAVEWTFQDDVGNWLPLWPRWFGWQFCEVSDH